MAKGAPDYTRTVTYTIVHEGIPGSIETSLGYWMGRTKFYEDEEFTVGESPRILSINTDLGRNAHDGFVIVDGTGDLWVSISDDGVNYGDETRLKKNEVLGLTNLDINKMKLRAIATTAYRVKVV